MKGIEFDEVFLVLMKILKKFVFCIGLIYTWIRIEEWDSSSLSTVG